MSKNNKSQDKSSNFKDYYHFPLRVDESAPFKALSADKDDYMMEYDVVDDMQKDDFYESLVAIINGDIDNHLLEGEFTYSKRGAFVLYNGIHFISIRGNGHLISSNFYDLSTEKAAEIQDNFGEYIVERLNTCHTTKIKKADKKFSLYISIAFLILSLYFVFAATYNIKAGNMSAFIGYFDAFALSSGFSILFKREWSKNENKKH